MQLFSEYVQWQNYAATEFALSAVNEERSNANVRRVEAIALVSGNPGKGEVMKAKAGYLLSPEVEQAKQDQLDAYAKRKLTEVMMQNCERTASLLSRELSRRIGGADMMRRHMGRTP